MKNLVVEKQSHLQFLAQNFRTLIRFSFRRFLDGAKFKIRRKDNCTQLCKESNFENFKAYPAPLTRARIASQTGRKFAGADCNRFVKEYTARVCGRCTACRKKSSNVVTLKLNTIVRERLLPTLPSVA